MLRQTRGKKWGRGTHGARTTRCTERHKPCLALNGTSHASPARLARASPEMVRLRLRTFVRGSCDVGEGVARELRGSCGGVAAIGRLRDMAEYIRGCWLVHVVLSRLYASARSRAKLSANECTRLARHKHKMKVRTCHIIPFTLGRRQARTFSLCRQTESDTKRI